MTCFSRPKSRIRVDDLIDGLILQIMTMIERKSSAHAKAAREGLAGLTAPACSDMSHQVSRDGTPPNMQVASDG